MLKMKPFFICRINTLGAKTRNYFSGLHDFINVALLTLSGESAQLVIFLAFHPFNMKKVVNIIRGGNMTDLGQKG